MAHRALIAACVTLLSLGCEGALEDGSTSRGGDRVRPVDGGSAAPRAQDGGAPWPGVDAGTTARRDAGGPAPSIDAGGGAGPGAGLTAEEQGLLEAINAERAGGGLPPVRIDERLLCAARRHALDVGGSGACGHVGADGSWPWDRAEACGFPQTTWTVNEIAAGPGFTDGADAVWGWSQSSGHYAALMHARATTLGVGVHRTCFIALFDCCVAGSE